MPLNLKSIFQFEKLENIIFEIGVFFLVIAPSISVIFLSISAVNGSLGRKDSYFKDKWNYPFLLATFLISMVSLSNNLQLISITIIFIFIFGYFVDKKYALSFKKASLLNN